MSDLKAFEALGETATPTIGELYSFEGLYYEEWEESGLIPEDFYGFDALRWQKYGAYCVRVVVDCHRSLDPPPSVTRRLSGDSVAEVRTLVRFLSASGSAADLASNQCLKGTLRVERVASAKWR